MFFLTTNTKFKHDRTHSLFTPLVLGRRGGAFPAIDMEKKPTSAVTERKLLKVSDLNEEWKLRFEILNVIKKKRALNRE